MVQQGDIAEDQDEGTPVIRGILATSPCSEAPDGATWTAGSACCMGAEAVAPIHCIHYRVGKCSEPMPGRGVTGQLLTLPALAVRSQGMAGKKLL